MLVQTLLGLIASGAAVIAAGSVLARAGDTISAHTGLGGLWIGSLLLATATSLPELATDIAAVRMGLPDLAAGDLFGSSMSNMLILAILTLMPGSDLFGKAALSNAPLIALAMTLTACAGIIVLAGPEVSFLRVGPGSWLLAIVYLTGIRLVLRRRGTAGDSDDPGRDGEGPRSDPQPRPDQPSIRRAGFIFAAASVVILFAAPLFASAAGDLAELTGLHASFVGTWLLGFSTSLPELATTIPAVRMRAYDLAVGNLFGSSAFNMTMFVPLDIAQGDQPLLNAVEPVHVVSAIVAIVLMAIALAGILTRTESRSSLLRPSGTMMISVYFAGLVLVYLAS